MKKRYKNYYVHGERNRAMEKIELTEEQINYIATYIEEESGYDMGAVLLSIENAIEAYNGGAR